MNNCCEKSGMTHGCNQGRDCPAREARDAEDGNPLSASETFALLSVIGAALLAIFAGIAGYVYATYGAQIADAFWHWMALIS